MTKKQEKTEMEANYNIKDYTEAKEHIVAVLVNEEKIPENAICKSAAQYGYEDLAIIFYLKEVVTIDENKIGNILITHEITKFWDWDSTMPEERLFMTALMNDNYRFLPLSEKFEEMGVKDLPFKSPLWIATNSLGNRGALAAIVLQETIKHKFPDGYFAIPSSIHEMLIIPKIDKDEADQMVKEVNENEVDSQDILSDHVYEF